MEQKNPQSLSEAIESLESAGKASAKDFKNLLEKDFDEIKQQLENLKPYLDGLKQNIETEVVKKKELAETKFKENPWLVLGVVGFFAFVLGLFFGTSKKNSDQ